MGKVISRIAPTLDGVISVAASPQPAR